MSGAAVAPLVSLDGVATAGAVAVAASDLPVREQLADRVLPVREDIATVLPWQGLRRGSTVAISEPGTLLLAMLAAATANGAWAAVVGLPSLGLLAAHEAGVAVDRLALVPRPGADLVTITGALLDGMDLVAVAGNVNPVAAKRLSARARHRRSILLAVGPWPGAEVELRCRSAHWLGLGAGHGHLRAREVTLAVGGRGAAARPRTTRLLLPDPAPNYPEPLPRNDFDDFSGSGRPGFDGPGRDRLDDLSDADELSEREAG